MKFKEVFEFPKYAEGRLSKEIKDFPLALNNYYLTGTEEYVEYLKLVIKTKDDQKGDCIIRPLKKEYRKYIPELKEALGEYIDGENNVKEILTEVKEKTFIYFY